MVKVPHAEPEHPGPVALHVTPWCLVSSIKLALNSKVCPWSILGGVAGLIATVTSKMLYVPPQPPINTRIESTSPSFLINLCLLSTVTHPSGLWVYQVCHPRIERPLSATGGKPRRKDDEIQANAASGLAEKRPLPLASRRRPESTRYPTVGAIRKKCDRLARTRAKPEAFPVLTGDSKVASTAMLAERKNPTLDSLQGDIYFYLPPRVMSILRVRIPWQSGAGGLGHRTIDSSDHGVIGDF